MGKKTAHWKSPLAATLLLVGLIAAASFFVTSRINQMEEQSSFVQLAEEAGKLARGMEQTVRSDREKLTLIAEIMAYRPGEMEEFLGLYQDTGSFFTRLELLLPGDVVVTSDGERKSAAGILSFAALSAQGPHVSDREEGLHGEGLVVRHYVPVTVDGETAAVLCGVIELGNMVEDLPYTPYSGETAVYIIDGATGDFLVDTWHAGQPLGNIWEMGSRPMAEGYDDAQLRQGLVDGESNFVVFVSNTTGEYLYFYYAPLSINQWRVAMSVPEDLVFSGARRIRSLLGALLGVESVVFVLYIGWMILYVRRETGEKQRQLDAINYIYDVEKLLFNAHEHRENISRSLEVVARMLPARRVAFTMLEKGGEGVSYLWEAGGRTELGSALLEGAPALADRFTGGREEVTARGAAEVRALLDVAPAGMEDLAAVPVEDSKGVLRGVLSASGLSGRTDCAAMLRSVGISYAMLSGNTRTYQEMRRQGTEDVLTGLYNRNRYAQDLGRIASACRTGLSCLFIDANGLHELNNTQGHEAGDRMLQAVARQIRTHFGGDMAYRVGGDEFIVFAVDEEREEVLPRGEELAAALEGKGGHVSVGVDWVPAPVEDLEQVVKQAEKRMYDRKRAYYEDARHDRRAR